MALAGFAGVVVAFRSKSLHKWSLRDKFRLWLLLGNALIPLFDCLFAMLTCDQTNAAFHLALVQRVLAPVEFPFWFFDLATFSRALG